MLLHGSPGSGKTALAASMAVASGVPYVRMISAENLVALDEGQRLEAIVDAFEVGLCVCV
jgi:vesicle-fusing ATPase